jgi:hypothetical protein
MTKQEAEARLVRMNRNAELFLSRYAAGHLKGCGQAIPEIRATWNQEECVCGVIREAEDLTKSVISESGGYLKAEEQAEIEENNVTLFFAFNVPVAINQGIDFITPGR